MKPRLLPAESSYYLQHLSKEGYAMKLPAPDNSLKPSPLRGLSYFRCKVAHGRH